MSNRRAFGILWLAAITACAPVTQHSFASENLLDPPGRPRNADRIMPVELRAVGGHTVLDAVRQLRPEFLRAAPPNTLRGDQAPTSVYLDARYAGGLETLATLSLTPVVEIRHLSAVSAKSVFGSYCKCDGGVILVRTRPSEP